MIAALRVHAAAGVTDLCVRFIGDDQRAQLDRFTKEVFPALDSRASGDRACWMTFIRIDEGS